MSITIKRYTDSDAEEWNLFLEKAKNSVFLFHRNYLNYHKHRFVDHSLFIYMNDALCALLPSNENKTTVFSHSGVTFGGLILCNKIKLLQVAEIFEAIVDYFKLQGFSDFYYKPVPTFYHLEAAKEDLYMMYLLKAELTKRDMGSVLDRHLPISFQERRRRSIKKARKLNVEIEESESFESFWKAVLEKNLMNKYGLKPVHSLEEIKHLKNQMPDNIKQYNAYLNGEIIAGTTLFVNRNTIHAQYISATEEGKSKGALDFLFDHLIHNEFLDRRFFSFGISSDHNYPKKVNVGLLEWKEGFGAKAYTQDCYRISLT